MKIIDCPLNGPRNISEFTYGGEYHPLTDPSEVNRQAWAEYVFFHDNHAGLVTEWWMHTATAFWFLVDRNTVTDEILRTYRVNEVEEHGMGKDG